MKRILAFLLAGIMLLSLCACGNSGTNDYTENQPSLEDNLDGTTDTFDETSTNDANDQINSEDIAVDYQAFKKLNLTINNAVGDFMVKCSSQNRGGYANPDTVKISGDKIIVGDGEKIIAKASSYNLVGEKYSATYDFVDNLIPVVSQINVEPLDTTKQSSSEREIISIDYKDSALVAESDHYGSVSFEYGVGATIHLQNGYFSFTFETEENGGFAFNEGIKKVVVSGENNKHTLSLKAKIVSNGDLKFETTDPRTEFTNLKVVLYTTDGKELVCEKDYISDYGFDVYLLGNNQSPYIHEKEYR